MTYKFVDRSLQDKLKIMLEHYRNGRYDLVEPLAKKISQQYQNQSLSWKVLGSVFRQTGRFDESLIANQKVIAISPNDAEAQSNLGNILMDLGRLNDAEKAFRKAILINSDFSEAHYNLGNTLLALGRLEEAEKTFENSILINPKFSEAYCYLGATLLASHKIPKALKMVAQSLKIKPTIEAKILFKNITKKIYPNNYDNSLAQLVITALIEPWCRPSEIMPFACRLLLTDKEFLQVIKHQSVGNIGTSNHDESLLSSIDLKEFNFSSLLQAMLTSGHIPDFEIEVFLTSLRYHLLKIATTIICKEDEKQVGIPLYCSLAQQCFINEYVYSQTPEEICFSNQLMNRLIQVLENGQSISEYCVVAIACYFPLYSIAGSEKLFTQKWSVDLERILKQQIQEPLEELNLRSTIPLITSITNQVSRDVQSQYEDNPYPRWVRLPKDANFKTLNSYVNNKLPLSPFTPLVDDQNPDILIAGCGTGQHSIGIFQLIKGAKILAIDLSISSIAYAKRKTSELGIESIEYAQADLLNLTSSGRSFDVIESSGVLHHLENPFEGWEVLLSLLRPHGLMRLGLYSELARRDIVKVRNLIIQNGIGSSFNEIRVYRKNLLELKKIEDFGFATSSSDFFSTSACRDLLFHVQEHRMNLKMLADFFQSHDLIFLGFDIDTSVIHAYKNRFPNDPSATNLEQWDIYEEENPNTFIGMYQFWLQRKY